MSYASLHNHSHASLLDGFATVEEYCDVAQETDLAGFGLTDHGSISLLYQFIDTFRSASITPVPGCEFYVAPQNPRGADVDHPVFYGPGGVKAGRNDVAGNGAYTHLTVLAINETGLKNLFALSKLSAEHKYVKPRIDFDMLANHNEGLVVFTGCPSSEMSIRILLDQYDEAQQWVSQLKDVFGPERLFVEVMNHGIDIEKKLVPGQLMMAKHMGLRLVATDDSHYARRSDAKHHEEMLCIQSGARMSDKPTDQGGRRFTFAGDQYYVKSACHMSSLFPEDYFPGALSNTLLVTEMASDLAVTFNPHLRPYPKIPEGFESDVEYVKHLVNEGFVRRYGHESPEMKKRAIDRVHKEFDIIYSSDFIGYFVTVVDYLKFGQSFSIFDDQGEIVASSLGVGRGSVGGSIIAYFLGISDVDPLKYGLYFERFLSAGRGSTYEIVYDDGTTERVNVSDTKMVDGHKKYVHQLKAGDLVR